MQVVQQGEEQMPPSHGYLDTYNYVIATAPLPALWICLAEAFNKNSLHAEASNISIGTHGGSVTIFQDMICLLKQAFEATYSGQASDCSGYRCREKETNSTRLITSMIMTEHAMIHHAKPNKSTVPQAKLHQSLQPLLLKKKTLKLLPQPSR